jgi:hypothetical protein
MDRQPDPERPAGLPDAPPWLPTLRYGVYLVRVLATDERSAGSVVFREVSAFLKDSSPAERMSLLHECARIARTLYDAIDGQFPGQLPPPVRPPWGKAQEDPDMLQFWSGDSDAMEMLTDRKDLGLARKWAGYGQDACAPDRYVAAVGRVCGFAADMVREAQRRGAPETEQLLEGIRKVLEAND